MCLATWDHPTACSRGTTTSAWAAEQATPSRPDVSDRDDRLFAALRDRYRIERELGAGGMATVYLAEDLKHQRLVAVKVLRPELAASLGHDRFLREISIAAKLHHSHIVPVYDSGQSDGFLFYVMPFVDGQSLRDRLSGESQLPLLEAVRILRDIADGLAYAHEQGVVHRDIKPENVMLSGRHALVTDFGIAKAVGDAFGSASLTATGIALGTPTYMSPEQATADPLVDHRADIYAFGAVAYELLAGRAPFVASTAQATVVKHLTESPAPVTTYRAEVPPELARLVMTCLEKSPADRMQSAVDLREVLDTIGTVTGATPALSRPADGGRTMLLAGAAMATTLLVSAGWYMGRESPVESFLARSVPTQFTFDGNVGFADIAPDGQLIAYSTTDGAGGAIWVRDRRGGSPVRVASIGALDPRRSSEPTLRWSPDGALLLYVGPDSLGRIQTSVYPRLGGPPRLTVPAGMYGVWSGAGQQVAIWGQETSVRLIDVRTDARIDITLPDSLGFRREGDWSNAQQRLVVTATRHGARAGSAIIAISPNDSAVRLIVKDSVPLQSPRWSAAGDEIFYLRLGDLWKVQIAADGAPRGAPALVRGGVNAVGISWAADGNTLATIVENRRRNLWIVAPDDPARTVAVTRGTAWNDGVPSPDGTRVAYLTRPRAESDGDLFVVPLAGGLPEQVTNRQEAVRTPAWSPSGTSLVYAVRIAGELRIRTLQLDNRRERTFERTQLGEWPPQWAPGDRILYQRPGNRNYHYLDPVSGDEEPLLGSDTLGWIFNPHVSPDGRTVVAFWNRPPRAGLWLVRGAPDAPRLLAAGLYWPVGWSADGSLAIASSAQTGEGIAAPIAGNGAPRPFRIPDFRRYDGCEAMPAQKLETFLCGVSERTRDVWVMTAAGASGR
jgi:Tol biopolymer transport system component/tRNA A-37 threonylcarbamoyl transferase component Bud32